jgi:hypothetical protein
VCTNYYRVTYFKSAPATAFVLTHFFPGEMPFYGRVRNATACVALVRKAAEEVRVAIFSSPLGQRK